MRNALWLCSSVGAFALGLATTASAQNTVVFGNIQAGNGTGSTTVCPTASNDVLVRGPNDVQVINCNYSDSIAIGAVTLGSLQGGSQNSVRGNIGIGRVRIGANDQGGGVVSFDNIVMGNGTEINGGANIVLGRDAGQLATAQSSSILGKLAGFGANLTDSFVGGLQSGQMSNQVRSVMIGTIAGIRSSGGDNVYLGTGAGADIIGSRNSIISGRGAAESDDAVALGSGSFVVSRSTALGNFASSTGSSSVSIGFLSDDGGQDDVVSIGNATGKRRIINLASGNLTASSSDAVTGAQLFTTNQNVSTAQSTANQGLTVASLANAGLEDLAAAFGAGARYDPASGTFALPSYSVSNMAFNDVGSALAALDGEVTQLENTAVRYDDASKSRLTLGAPGSSAIALRNVAAGAVASASSDAVNGSQLFATNQNVSAAQLTATFAQSRADTANSGLAATAAVFGASASYDSLTGAFQGPSFFVRGNSYGDVASALAALDNEVTQADTIAVRYDDQGRTSVSLGSGQPGLAAQPVAVTNVADGLIDASSSDAVNGSQLFATNMNTLTAQESADQANAGLAAIAASLGGGASYDAATGSYLSPTYALSSGSFNTVGDALAALDGNSVQFDNAAHSAITLGGAGASPVALTNIAGGVLSATSSDAVNGSQLFATNQQVAQNSADIASLTTNQQSNATEITNLTNAVASGTVGLVQQAGGAPGNGQIMIGASTGGASIDVAGMSGTRSVTGVSAGAVSASSSDVVNGSQLFATNQNVALAQQLANQANAGLASAAAALGGGATYDSVSGTWSGPSFDIGGTSHNNVGSALAALDDAISGVGAAAANSVQYDDATHSAITLGGAGGQAVAVNNVAAATLSATSTDAVNGSQLFSTNQQVSQNTAAIAANAAQTSALSNAINNGTVGLVQQTGGDPNGAITVGAATGGKSVSIAGTSGTRTLTGLSAGAVSATSTDAVNGSQLFALTQRFDAADGRLIGLQRDLDDVKYDLRELRKDANSGIATAVALGALPQATNPGRFALGMGTGIRDGQMAIALGASWRSNDDMFVVNLRGGYDQSSVTAGAGIGIEF